MWSYFIITRVYDKSQVYVFALLISVSANDKKIVIYLNSNCAKTYIAIMN